MTGLGYTGIGEALRKAVPEFSPAIDEHIAGYGELLPHVLFGDLTRFVLTAHQHGRADTESRCLAFIERALQHGDDRVKNLVQASFVENIPPWNPARSAFIASWPSGLRAEAERQRDWRAGSPQRG